MVLGPLKPIDNIHYINQLQAWEPSKEKKSGLVKDSLLISEKRLKWLFFPPESHPVDTKGKLIPGCVFQSEWDVYEIPSVLENKGPKLHYIQ